LGAHLVFLDESGFLLIPTVLKTWAPRGHTPCHRHRTRRDKVSVISAISVSAHRYHLSLYYRVYPNENLNGARVCEFIRQLLHHLRGPLFVLLDNASIHHGEPLDALCERHRRLIVHYFPGYAPQLNPDEGIWNLSKRELANGRPDNLAELTAGVTLALERLRQRPDLLRGCIIHSELPPFLS
jgi:transposase